MVNRTRGVLAGPTWSIYRFPVSLCSSRQPDSPGSPKLSHSREHRTCLGTSHGTVGSKSSTVPTLSSKGLYNDSGLLPRIKNKNEFISKKNRKCAFTFFFVLIISVYMINMISLGTDFPKYFLYWDPQNISYS